MRNGGVATHHHLLPFFSARQRPAATFCTTMPYPFSHVGDEPLLLYLNNNIMFLYNQFRIEAPAQA